MAMNITFSGGREVERALLELSTKGAQKVGRFALRKAARAIQVAARDAVRKKSGELAKRVTVKVDRGRDRSKMFAVVKVDRKGSFRPRKTDRQSRVKGKLGPARYDYQIGSKPEVYGAFLEWGAPAHGMPAYPWMRRAWESAGGENALAVIGRELGTGLEREAAARVTGGYLRGMGFGGK